MDYTFNFPAVRGVQAGNEYYVAMVPLKTISRLFPDDDEYVAPEYRAQRRLNTARIPVMMRYILDNRDNYVFSALAASIDGEYQYIPSTETDNIGILSVSMDSRFLINDGQHRKAAILEALKEDSSLKDETISIVFFVDQGLERSQQIFTDLNKHAVKTSNSISELYDSRDQEAVITRQIVSEIPFFNEYTDKETDNLGKFSSNLFTLNTFYKANKRALKGFAPQDCYSELLHYWKIISQNIKPWNELIDGEISKKALRESYIVTQGVVIQALGVLGNEYLNNNVIEESLTKLNDINWRRSSDLWQLRTIKANGRIISNSNAVLLTSNVIKNSIGVKLSREEQLKENQFLQEKLMNTNISGE